MNLRYTQSLCTAILLLLTVLPFADKLMASDRKAISEDDRVKAEYIFLEAEKQRNMGRDDAFHHLLQYAHSLDPENSAIAYYLGYSRLMKSNLSVSDSLFSSSLRMMRKHVDAHPEDKYEAMLYANGNMIANQVQEGLRVLKIQAERNPHNVEVQLSIADAYARLEDYRNAIAAYDSVQQWQGQSVQLSARKVRAYQALNDTVGAIGEMRSLLATAPRNVDYNLAMGNMMLMFGERDSALTYYGTAIRARKWCHLSRQGAILQRHRRLGELRPADLSGTGVERPRCGEQGGSACRLRTPLAGGKGFVGTHRKSVQGAD